MLKRLIVALAVVGIAATAAAQGTSSVSDKSIPDKEWKQWLEHVHPLMHSADFAAAKKTPPSERAAFREQFWRARNPNPTSPDNAVRAGYEERVRNAERRFRVNGSGSWNDCGRTFMILGKPDSVQLDLNGSRLLATSEREVDRAELWTYRKHPRLPKVREDFTFGFNLNCEAVGDLAAERILQRAAASYVFDRQGQGEGEK
jgi:GWxTD domain-containing protein